MPTSTPISVLGSATRGIQIPASGTAHFDAESQGWIDRLGPHSPERETAVAALHALLLKQLGTRSAAGARLLRTYAATITTTSRTRAPTTHLSPC
jgi:hypothetical protein